MENLAHISFTGALPATRSLLAPVPNKTGTVAERTGARRSMLRESESLHPFMAWVLERAGLRPAAYRVTALHRRIPACLRRLRVASAGSARDLVERRPELLSFVLSTALIGVSEFFRDRPVFDYLEGTVLPELLKARTGLRVCGAGVSGGQEIYSMAMLLAEAGALEQSTLLGIDCRVDAIRKAKAGFFNAEDMAGVEPDRRERFFQPVASGWRASPVIKDRIRWRAEDLLALNTGETWDLILFRNVAIYFTEAHGTEAWALLCGQLAPGGFLITGKAEKPPDYLSLMRVTRSIYQKK